MLPLGLLAQNFEISGLVGDHQKQPLPFASVMVRGTTAAGMPFHSGTNTNKLGRFALRAPEGNYKLTVQFIGYTRFSKEIILKSDITQMIQLQPENLEMKGVSISSGEDPAYPIVREAIKKRSYYHDQLNSFSAKVYIKGVQRLRSTPENLGKLMKLSINGAMTDSDLLGVLYLSESETEYHYKKPDYQKEVMYSSKISGNNQAFSYNQASDIIVDYYQSKLELGTLSDRPFISPIADNALFFYKYELLGSFEEDGKMIFKIKVKPKRKLDPCFSGIMYLQDVTYRIYAMDMMLGKDAKIDFVDSLSVKQQFAAVNDTVWMPSSLNFSFVFSAFGFKGDGYFNSVFNDYKLNPEFPRKFFKGELLKVEEGANKKDSAYWEQNRPMPLTQEEIDDYRKKDSLEKVRNSRPYQDSIDKITNRFTWRKALLGYQWFDRKSNLKVGFEGLPQSIQFNTVQGFSLGYQAKIDKDYEKNRALKASVQTRYGFSQHLWAVNGKINYLKSQPKDERYFAEIGRYVNQINRLNPINPFMNTLYTLASGRNYGKYLLTDRMMLGYSREWFNGVFAGVNVAYERGQELFNTTTFNISKDPWITPNNPFEDLPGSKSWGTYHLATIGLNSRIVFAQKYYSRPNQKVRLESEYPILNIQYQFAPTTSITNVGFQYVEIRASDQVKWGLLGSGKWIAEAGTFFQKSNLPAPLIHHFNGNQVLLSEGNADTWRLLPYYGFSTGGSYWSAHYEHYFQRFLFNKLPMFRKNNWREIAGIHYLQTSDRGNFLEANFGISGLGKVGRVDFVLARKQSGLWMRGLTIGVRLGG